ncbi:MAG: hypothetical protein ACOX5R_07095 [bacterium]
MPSKSANVFLGIVLFYDAIKFLMLNYFETLTSSIIFPLLTLIVSVPISFQIPFRGIGILTIRNFWLIVLFIYYCMLSIIYSPNPLKGYDILFQIITEGVLPGLLLGMLFLNNQKINWSVILFFGLLYLATVLIYAEPYFYMRYSLPTLNPIWCAKTSLAIVLVSIYKKNISNYLRYTAFFIGLLVAILTQSRGPFFSFLLIIAALTGFRLMSTGYSRIGINIYYYGY